MNEKKTYWPTHGWVGLALIAIFWPLNWLLPGLRTHWGFFPLWLGYCLTIDAFVVLRRGHSLLTRNGKAYIGLFLISAPIWWLFEVLNWRTQNWFYDGREFFSNIEYFLLASLSFSTVIPAVFGSAELLRSFRWMDRLQGGPLVRPTRRNLLIFFFAGWLMLSMLLIWPRYFYVFLWISIFFIIAPINALLGNRSLLNATAARDWRPVLSLWAGCLLCSLFWEGWNFFSYPKWIYDVPFFNVLQVFEMPLPGYLGYLPFSLELFAIYHLIIGLLKKDDLMHYVQLDARC